ncbi:acyltransferase family protein [Nocardioides piscis]|uniref:Acyltransferase n=1 Tax=Nocardioides piscis TaxID=2714938 RepID=A0A6G7YEI2_9ACTN|nr:acyltransferase [Nocardioides piscis]QIK75215.1 acyltransferase [Nocardioides piscis]
MASTDGRTPGTHPLATRRPIPPPLPWTDGIRALACLCVVWWHALLTVVPSDPTAAQRLLVLPLGGAARASVLVFIVLSGYLLGRHWRPGLRRYLVRRSWRLLPPYWATVALTVVAMAFLGLRNASGSHWDSGLPFTWERVAADLLLITDFTGEVPLSHQLWTIPVEFHLYFLAPLIVLLWRPRWLLAVAALGTLAVVLLAPQHPAPFFVFAFMAAFFSGVRRQQLTSATPVVVLRLLAPLAAVGLAVGVVGFAAGTLGESQARYYLLDAAVAPLVLGLLLWGDLCAPHAAPLRWLTVRPLAWVGTRSYSIYLVHGLVLELVWRALVRPLDLTDSPAIGTVAVLGTVASLAAGLALYLAVERPSARRSAAVR